LGRIPDETIAEVRGRVDIVDIIGRHLTLKKSGRNYVGLCPFHGEKTPSFNVSSDRQGFFCFGCQKGGNAFTFLMEIENLTFPEAVRTLARECGVEVPETGGGDRGEFERMHRANEVAQASYRAGLAEAGNAGSAYLEKRGIDAASIERFGIGFAPDRWDTVANALRAEGIEAEVGVKAGLLAERQSGGHYDRMRGRVTFPIHDVRGRTIGFGGRAVGEDQQPKYLNSPESPLFQKRRAVYGYPDALSAIRSEGRAVVVEGYFDRIALSRAGIDSAIATCGTALTVEHVRDLLHRTKEVVLLFDGDEAGQRAIAKALEILLPQGMRVRSAALPGGEDPDSYLAREGPDALRALVDRAPAAISRVIENTAARGHATPWEKSDAVADVGKLLALIVDPVERGEFASQLALAVGTDVRNVDAAVRAQRRGENPRDAVPVKPRRAGPEDRNLRNVIRSLVEHPRLAERIPGLELFPACPATDVIDALLAANAGEAGALDVDAICEGLGDEPGTLLREVAAHNETLDGETAARIIDDTLQWFEKRRKREHNQELTQRLRASGDDWKSILRDKQQMRAGSDPQRRNTGHPH
jgi:DNA primase